MSSVAGVEAALGNFVDGGLPPGGARAQAIAAGAEPQHVMVER